MSCWFSFVGLGFIPRTLCMRGLDFEMETMTGEEPPRLLVSDIHSDLWEGTRGFHRYR